MARPLNFSWGASIRNGLRYLHKILSRSEELVKPIQARNLGFEKGSISTIQLGGTGDEQPDPTMSDAR